MASLCNGTGFVSPGKFCTQCNGSPFLEAGCAEARRRGQGAELTKAWESASLASGPMTRVIRHSLGRIPTAILVQWSGQPFYKAAKAGDPEPAARWTIREARREVGEVEITVEHGAGAEPGEYRLVLLA